MSRHVVVLGAAGYLGRNVAQAARAQGHRVTAVTRKSRGDWQTPGLLVCDAGDPVALRRAAAGADCVVNAINADASTRIAVASNLRGLLQNDAIGQVVHVSSLSVYGQESGVMHEGIRPVPYFGSRQADAMVQAERILAPEDRFGDRVAVLRPGCLYGPGAPVWVDGIARLLQARRLGWLGARGAGTSLMIHVQDLARAIARMAGQSVSGIYNIAATDAMSWNDYFLHLASLTGALPLRQMGAAGLYAETWTGGARHMLVRQISGATADCVTPDMARAFRARTRVVSVRAPFAEAGAFRCLRDGVVEAAEAFLRQSAPRRPIRQAALYWPRPAES